MDPQAVATFVKAVLDQFWLLCGVPAFLGVLGLLVGSFLNVVIYRKPVIMMREWLLDTGGILGDGDTWKQVFGQPQPAELTEAGRTIDKHICSLRQKLASASSYLKTVPGEGYRFSGQ